ncbi:AAA family ATPase [Streptomyces coeruleoprunus]|uniref:AAA family ATPase n=1 Tax=Streptomyces coeruleoprunus TaxID=285563 RepID=A0ABV9XC10_9ACTN
MSGGTRCGTCRTEAPPGARFCPECGTPLTGGVPSADSRRIVTAVFIDLVGSTVLAETLDPEALRRTMDRYYSACTAAVTERGGVVEKFIGDAVMAVFGAFVSHEDDALRAVQAAYAVREALAGTGAEADAGVRLDIHCGIASGEAVVAGAAGGGARVVGDVVHTAARLQSHARVHEILIGDETARLVGSGVRMEAVAPLRLKGKRDLVTAWRVVGLVDGPGQENLVPMVGRERELASLEEVFASVRRERRCRRVTVTGPTGIGKSRLVREFLATRPAADAVVLRGTCPPYGAGLAYRPLAEAVWSLPGGWEEAVSTLEALRPSADRAVTALAVALGVRAENGLPVSVDEIGWAFRRLVEALGRRAPLVLVLEDFHWAEPTLLDTIGEVVDGVTDAEVLIICVARPERAGAPGDSPGLRLEALPVEQTERLVGLLADRTEVTAQETGCTDEALAWVVQECDGNPLFAELLVEDLVNNRSAVQGVPTTIRVLLTAWLDRLPAADRAVLERAAGVGGSFTAEDVRTLAGDSPALTDDAVDAAVSRLLQTRVIHPAGPPGTFRFTRMLARDTLYEMTSKTRRAHWHTLLANRLETRLPPDSPPGKPTASPGRGAGGSPGRGAEASPGRAAGASPGRKAGVSPSQEAETAAPPETKASPTPGAGASGTPGTGTSERPRTEAPPAPDPAASPIPGTDASPTPSAATSAPPGTEAPPTPGPGASPTVGPGASPTPGVGASPTPGPEASAPPTGASPAPGTPTSTTPGTEAPPTSGAGNSPAPGTGASPAPATRTSAAPGMGASPTPETRTSATPGTGAPPAPGAGATPVLAAGAVPVPGVGASLAPGPEASAAPGTGAFAASGAGTSGAPGAGGWTAGVAGVAAASPGPAVEGDLAYHLEAACRLLSEVDPGDPGLPALTRRAARALVTTGYRALHRRDLPAAVALMERGRALTSDGDPEHRVLAVRITDAYAALGRWESARLAVAEAEARGGQDLPTRHTCAILRRTIALRSGDPGRAEDAPVGRPAADDGLSWCRLHQLTALRSLAEGRTGAAEAAMRDALTRARDATDAYEENRILVSICELTQWSPTPLTKAIALCEDLARRFDADRCLLVPILLTRARHLALSGRVDEARADVELARRHSADLKLTLGDIAADQTAGLVESLCGAHAAAARHYAAAADGLGALGQTTTAATLRVYAAREAFRAGGGNEDTWPGGGNHGGRGAGEGAGPAGGDSGDEAPPAGEAAAGVTPELRAQAVHLALRARRAARAGAYEEAVRTVERAVATLDRTDDPCLIGDVWFEAARVLDAAGATARARRAAERALAALTAKGAALPARAVRAWLTERDAREEAG